MNIKKIFKIRNIKKLKVILVKKILKLFGIFKNFKLERLKKKKYIFGLIFILILIFLLVFLSWKIFNGEKVEEEKIEIETEEISVVIGEEKEMEDRSEEETVYGKLGNFWIEIDTEDLKITAPIIEGITGGNKDEDNKILDRGVGHHIIAPFPNRESGNVVLSGHRWFPGDIPARTVFIDLDKLKIDDEVKLYFDEEEFIYKITDSKIIDVEKNGSQKNDVNILKKTEKPTITIYTCTPKHPLGTPTKRLVYFGELVK
ncbi:MAG: sortase [Candidatus Moranbacteria bacterium]|nr:sortase [Candidatus Moranbacteria bacterium]